AAVDLAQVFHTPSPKMGPSDGRLPPAEQTRLMDLLAAAGIASSAGTGGGVASRLDDLRALYEPYLEGLAEYLLMALPPWVPEPGRLDDWQTTADGVTAPAIAALVSHKQTTASGHTG
ncbi:MAG: hypothetical protein ACXVDI_20115, partial [Ktedonobacterales bacterium]